MEIKYTPALARQCKVLFCVCINAHHFMQTIFIYNTQHTAIVNVPEILRKMFLKNVYFVLKKGFIYINKLFATRFYLKVIILVMRNQRSVLEKCNIFFIRFYA